MRCMITTEIHQTLPPLAGIEPGTLLGDAAAVVVFGGLAAVLVGLAAGPIREAWRLHRQERHRRTLPPRG